MTEEDRIYSKVNSILKDDHSRSSYIGQDDYVCLTKNGININFHLKNPSLDIQNIYRTIKRAQKIIKENLNYELNVIKVSIYDSIDEMRTEMQSKSLYASWIAGIFDGTVKVILEREDEEPESLYIILTHEIIHLAIYSICKGKCPYWLDEGISVYLSQELPDEYLKIIYESVRNESYIPFEALENWALPNLDENIRKLVYAQTFLSVEYLVETYGWNKISSILPQFKTKDTKAVLETLSLNYYLFERQWLRWLNNKVNNVTNRFSL